MILDFNDVIEITDSEWYESHTECLYEYIANGEML